MTDGKKDGNKTSGKGDLTKSAHTYQPGTIAEDAWRPSTAKAKPSSPPPPPPKK